MKELRSIRLACLAALFFAGCRSTESSPADVASAPAPAPVELPPESRGRPRDPWVFRSVLDGNPRMLTLALHDELWLALDVERGALWRVWKGDVHFTGTVYDTLHGPQPLSRGPAYFGPPSRVGADGTTLPAPPSETARASGLRFATGEPAELRWLGHRLLEAGTDGRRGVELLWRADRRGRAPVTVALRPEAHDEAAGVALRLELRVDGLGEGESLCLDLPAATEPPRGVRRSDALSLEAGRSGEPSRLFVRGSGRIDFLLPELPEPPAPDALDPEDPFVEPTLATTGGRA